MVEFLERVKHSLCSFKHALFRFLIQQWFFWRALFERDEPVIRHVAMNTHSYLARVLAPDALEQAYIAIDSPQSFAPPPAKTFDPNRLMPRANSMYREGFVVRLENARVLGNVGHILTRDGTLLADISFEHPDAYYQERDRPPLRHTFEQTQPLAGTTCNLATSWAFSNYFHYLFELLPRCEMVRRSGIALETIQHFIVNPFEYDIFWQGLNVVGVPKERARVCSAFSAFESDVVIAPSTLRGTGHKRKWVCEWLKQTFAPNNICDSDRTLLYVGRDDATRRQLTNQAEILEQVLLPLGFQHVFWNGRSIHEQAALFAKANVVVGLNGAALSNLVFCRPGTRVIVLHHPGRLSRYFYELSHTLGLDYYYLVGETTNKQKPGEYDSPYFVNPDALAALLHYAGVDFQ